MYLSGILFLAMVLVSLVWGMFLKRDMVAKEVERLRHVLEASDEVERLGGSGAEYLLHSGIECFSLQVGDRQYLHGSDETVLPEGVVGEVRENAVKNKDFVILYHGTQWAVFSFSHRQVVVGKPIQDEGGGIVGTVVAGATLEPVYARIRGEGKVVFLYIIVNTIIFAGIGLLRMMHIIVKPVDRFISLSRQYSPQSELDFFPDGGNNEFAILSRSLNSLFGRIKADNEKLRATVGQLEVANFKLERNSKEMVRTEKLAAIGRLSAGLAHEIGNPLGIVQGYVDLLGRVDLSSEERLQFVQNSQHELDRIKTLLRQLLDFARPVIFAKLPISVNHLICEVLDLAAVEKTVAHCTIIKQLEADSDLVLADADSLRQVLLNCLLNAADAMAHMNEYKEICVATYNSGNDGSGGSIHIALRDNGPGVVTNDLPYVFDPFFTTKETGRGTGLGLFVCHTIMERLGGTIILRNNPSGGAEVIITLPTTTDNSLAI